MNLLIEVSKKVNSVNLLTMGIFIVMTNCPVRFITHASLTVIVAFRYKYIKCKTIIYSNPPSRMVQAVPGKTGVPAIKSKVMNNTTPSAYRAGASFMGTSAPGLVPAASKAARAQPPKISTRQTC